MHRWIARAAGGTSQRLKLGAATVRSRLKKPASAAMLADIELSWRWSSVARSAPRLVRR